MSGHSGGLSVEDLLPQDVGVPAVLGEFAQDVEVHPAQRERAAPVAVDPVVQPGPVAVEFEVDLDRAESA
jgi:hypothetical protein